jgi:hypothetical protein
MANGRRRRRRRSSPVGPLLLIASIVLILGVGGLLTWHFVKSSKTKSSDTGTSQGGGDEWGAGPELNKAVAETDKIDPNWRLKDIVAALPKLDPAKNGATLALNAARKLPPNFGAAAEGFNTRFDPSQPISDFEAQRLRQVVQANGQALGEARKIAFAPQGRYDVQFNLQSPMDTLLPELQDSRKVAQLLLYDSELRATERDGPAAMQSANALLTLARYPADEPMLISQLVRIAEGALGIAALERAMTCANISDDTLTATQKLLESEGAAIPLYIALRGERAMLQIVSAGGNKEGFKADDAGRAWLLRTMNRAVNLAAKETRVGSSAWATLTAEVLSGPDAKRIVPAFDKVLQASAKHAASMRSAAVALAAERYRRAKGDWPGDLKDLAPNYINALPTDPFTGGQLQYLKAADGIIVYALGPNKSGFTAVGSGPNENSGFRLVNPDRRR